MGKLGPPDDLMGKLGAGPRPRIIFKQLIRLHCTLSNLWAPNFNWQILDDMQAEKEYMGPKSPFFVSYFKDCVMITNVWFLVFFFLFVIYLRLMGIYQVGAPSGNFKSFVCWILSFRFFFLFFLFFFFWSLSWGPLQLRSPWIVHPCHPVATPLMLPLIKYTMDETHQTVTWAGTAKQTPKKEARLALRICAFVSKC